MSRQLIRIISEQTEILLFNVGTTIETCDMDFMLCGMPVWKHLYHALHSCDRWFINPGRYQEPPFHVPGLNSLDAESAKKLSRGELSEYYVQVRSKVMDFLDTLEDEQLAEAPEDCPFSRLALILGQYRHLCFHLGNINGTTILQTGLWPRVVGLDGDFSKGLYE